MLKVNLHTHTARCHHALGTDEEYVLAAIQAGYTKLGFSDHTPFPYIDGYVNCDKMTMDELEGYISSVLSLREKYRGQIEILLGLECEAVPEFFPFLAEMKEKTDYLIFGNHGDKRFEPFSGWIREPARLGTYLESCVRGMETGLFLYLAHPDLMFASYPVFDDTAASVSRELCRNAKKLGIPLEYNMNGLIRRKDNVLGYPYPGFWQIAAEENCTAVVGVDAHCPNRFLEADVAGARVFLTELGMTVLDDPMDAKK